MVSEEQSIRRIIIGGLLLAITLLLVLTRIGMIPMPTPAGNATVAHIPAIIGAVLAGPVVGLTISMGFGFASFMNAAIPMFRDPVVAIVPRLLIGPAAAWVYLAAKRASRTGLLAFLGALVVVLMVFSYEMSKTSMALGILGLVLSLAAALIAYRWVRQEEAEIIAIAVAAAAGSLTNTVLVLAAAVFRNYIAAPVAVGIGITHGIPEAVASAVITVAVVAAVRQIGTRRRGSRL